MSYKIVDTTLGSAVADTATTTVSYPVGTDAGTFKGAVGHKLMLGNLMLNSPADFTLSFGATNITITNKYGSAWASGSRVYLELQTVGGDNAAFAGVKRTIAAWLAYINLGAPDAAVANGVGLSQSATGAALINGSLASSGVATFDVPRNVVAAWTGTAVLTVTGKDEYGNTVVESSASGTSLAGKKAFKSVSRCSFSASVTLATIGTGDVLGLPFFFQDSDFVLKEVEDNAAATAGTFVNGDETEATALTGDVRGTYDPSSVCDGAKVLRLVVAATDPTYLGLAQFAG